MMHQHYVVSPEDPLEEQRKSKISTDGANASGH